MSPRSGRRGGDYHADAVSRIYEIVEKDITAKMIFAETGFADDAAILLDKFITDISPSKEVTIIDGGTF